MKLRFTGLIIENFASYVGRHKLPLRLFQPGLYYVQGNNLLDKELKSNDSGKSTLLNTLSWCLYGCTTNGLRSPDLEPKEALGSTTKVIVFMKIDGEKVKIKRTARPNLLTCNGKHISQPDLERKIGLPFIVFKQTVLYGQKQPLFLDLSNKEKMALLSEAANLERWELRSIRAGDRVKELTKRHQEKSTRLEANLAAREVALNAIKRAKKDTAIWLQQRQKRMNALQVQLDENEAILKGYARQSRLADDETESYAKALGNAQAQVVIDREAITTFDKSQHKIYMERELASKDVERYTDELNDLSTDKTCPRCGQKIKRDIDVNKHKKKILSNLKVAREKLDSLKMDTKGRQKLIDAHTNSRIKVSSIESKYDAARKASDQLHRSMVQTEATIASTRSMLADSKDMENPHDRAIKTLRKKLLELKEQRLQLRDDIRKLERKIDNTRYWVKGFKEIRLLLIEELLAELELSTNQILETVGLVGWSVKYMIEKETKSGTIKTGIDVLISTPRWHTPVKWESWGGGVGQRLRLASSLALSEILLNHAGIETNLEILDEPTKHMVQHGVDSVIELLGERAKQLKRKILYVDHLAQDGAKFSGVVKIIKDKEGSRIDTGSIH